MLNEQGELTTVVAVTRNINEKKKLELAAYENEQKYRLLTENMEDFV